MRRVVIRPHVSQVRLTLLVPQPKGTILGSFGGLQQSSNRMIFHLETIFTLVPPLFICNISYLNNQYAQKAENV